MTSPDRWQHIERVYHAALARDEGERAAFVCEACEGDDALRREVESLIAYEVDAHRFLSAPAIELLAPRFIPSPRVLTGRRLGPYEITSLLGTGGMGEVYRARDTKLARDVAIKILPDVFAGDSDRRARFEREARLLASLNHPHVGAIYGLEDRDGIHGLVLELVEGKTLAERIREGALPMREALTIARQVADALHAAHEKGIVHRDLKPANIALTRDGTAKVLDFGLAKSIADESAADPAQTSATGASGIAGTAAYMSPEQARGRPVDERADVWAFGCVLWVMLTGRAAFASETVSGTIAAVLERGPDWRLMPPATPASITRLLQHCLEHDPERRLRDVAAARIEIDRVLEAAAVADARPSTRRLRTVAVAAAVLALSGILAIVSFRSTSRFRRDVTFTQLTNFTDAAVAPAVSPDGRMVAFIRGERPFLSTDQVYVKMVPDGEAVQLTHDPRPKYGVTFSPDGSRVAYTAVGSGGWTTYTVSPRGGEPALMLENAGGLTWLDPGHVLFSEVKTGLHMGIVTATENRSDRREVYFPQHERSMAHYSFISPDRRWALIVEMDYRPVWEPCRLIPLDGSSRGRYVGPTGRCSSAGWSPDGRWMYFSVEIEQESHLWRQRFPDGVPEQLTFGPSQEDGVAVSPDGSLITSIGMEQSAIWVHDARGERPLSSEGDVIGRIGSISLPSFSPDGRRLHYLRRASPGSAAELWSTDIASGKSEPLMPGVGMAEYDISRDGTQVVFTSQAAGEKSEMWVARLDRSAQPKRIASDGENWPYFGPAGQILFRFTDGKLNYLGRMNADGSARAKVVEYPIATIQRISPDRRWLVAITPWLDGRKGTASMAIPTGGGEPRVICPGSCDCAWSPDGRLMYVQVEDSSRTGPGKMLVLPVTPETGLPELPETGIQSAVQAPALRGSWILERSGILPGLDRDTYAMVKTRVHRNLFRIPPP